MSIKVSKKYGLNPTIPICFWCGNERNEIALLGKTKGDQQAPMQCIIDYDPCDECKAKMESGIVLIEAVNSPLSHGQEEIQKGCYPTGRWMVMTEEGIRKLVNDKEQAEIIIKSKKTFTDKQVFSLILENNNLANQERTDEDEKC